MAKTKPVTTDPPDRGMVRQANALVKSAQSMELNEKRLIMLAMSRIQWGDDEFLTQDIPVTELAQWLGGNPYQEGRKAADGLLYRLVEVLEDGGEQTKFQWTTLSAYIPAHKHRAGVACVRIRFNEELSPFLLQLRDRYNQIPLTHMLPMPSYNSQRLYEILWHDSHAGSKDVLTYEIDRLKVYIGLRDQQGKWEKYKPWKDFKKVLEKAIEDFNAHGSLRIKSYTGKRQSKRSYSHVLFRLEKIVQPELSKPSEVVGSIHPEVLALVGELEQSGYTQDPFGAIQTHGIEVVRQTLQLAREAERKAADTNKPIYNVGGLIASMLRQGVAAKRVTDLQKPTRLSNQKAELRAQELVDAYQLALTEHANGMWAAMSERQQREVHDHMRAELSGRLVEYLDTTGWQGRGYASVRNTFLLDTYRSDLPDALADVRSFSMSTGSLTQHSEEERERILVRACSLHADPEASDHASL